MTIEGPRRVPVPRYLVLAFMASMAIAAGYSSQCYVEELVKAVVVMPTENN